MARARTTRNTRDSKGRALGRRSGTGRSPNTLRGEARQAAIQDLRSEWFRFYPLFHARRDAHAGLQIVMLAIGECLSVHGVPVETGDALLRCHRDLADVLSTAQLGRGIGSLGWRLASSRPSNEGLRGDQPRYWKGWHVDASGRHFAVSRIVTPSPGSEVFQAWLDACRIAGQPEAIAIEAAGLKRTTVEKWRRRTGGTVLQRERAEIEAVVREERQRLVRAKEARRLLEMRRDDLAEKLGVELPAPPRSWPRVPKGLIDAYAMLREDVERVRHRKKSADPSLRDPLDNLLAVRESLLRVAEETRVTSFQIDVLLDRHRR